MKKKKIVKMIIIGTLMMVGVGVWGIYYIFEMTRDAYAQEWVAGLVIGYLKKHHNAWPQNWDDLFPLYQIQTQKSPCPCSFEGLQERVGIDWTVDVKTFLLSPSPSKDENAPKIIWLKSGRDVHWTGFEANDMIYQYFIKHRTRVNDPKQLTPITN